MEQIFPCAVEHYRCRLLSRAKQQRPEAKRCSCGSSLRVKDQTCFESKLVMKALALLKHPQSMGLVKVLEGPAPLPSDSNTAISTARQAMLVGRRRRFKGAYLTSTNAAKSHRSAITVLHQVFAMLYLLWFRPNQTTQSRPGKEQILQTLHNPVSSPASGQQLILPTILEGHWGRLESMATPHCAQLQLCAVQQQTGSCLLLSRRLLSLRIKSLIYIHHLSTVWLHR